MTMEKDINRIKVVLAEKKRTNKWLAEQLDTLDMTALHWKTNKIQPSMAHSWRLPDYSQLTLGVCWKWISTQKDK